MTNKELKGWAEMEFSGAYSKNLDADVAKAVLRLLKRVDGVCEWHYEQDEDCWYGGCHFAWMLMEGTLKQNGMTCCPNCGKRIKEVKGKE